MNKDLSKRTKDFIEWELKEISGQPLQKRKPKAALVNGVIQEVDEEPE